MITLNVLHSAEELLEAVRSGTISVKGIDEAFFAEWRQSATNADVLGARGVVAVGPSGFCGSDGYNSLFIGSSEDRRGVHSTGDFFASGAGEFLEGLNISGESTFQDRVDVLDGLRTEAGKFSIVSEDGTEMKLRDFIDMVIAAKGGEELA